MELKRPISQECCEQQMIHKEHIKKNGDDSEMSCKLPTNFTNRVLRTCEHVMRHAGIYPSPGFRSGWTRSSEGRGFSEWVAVPTCLSRPGFQSQTEGSSRGAMVRRAERWEAMSAESVGFHGDDIR